MVKCFMQRDGKRKKDITCNKGEFASLDIFITFFKFTCFHTRLDKLLR